MKNKITLLFLCLSIGLIAQPGKIKFNQMENPATSSVNLQSGLNVGSFFNYAGNPVIFGSGGNVLYSNTGTPATRSVTINNISYDLSSDRTYTTNFIPTLVKSSSYTLVPFNFVPVDISAGSLTLTLPPTPTDRTYESIKIIGTSTANVLTVKTGTASDVFNRVGGVTSFTLNALNQGYQLLYSTLTNVWYIIGDDLPKSYLDGLYWGQGGNTNMSAKIFGTTDTSQVNIYANNSPNVKISSVSGNNVFTWFQGGSGGYKSNITFRDLSTYGFSVATIYLGTPPSQQGALNYFAWSDTSIVRINAPGTLQFLAGNAAFMTGVPTKSTASGVQIDYSAINVAITAGNVIHANYRACTYGFPDNATTATAQKIVIAGNTYSAATSATITNPIGLDVTRPSAGTNMSFTNPAWSARFTGNVNITANSYVGGSLVSPLALMHFAAPPTSTCALKFTTHTIPTLNAGEMDYNSATGFNWGSASVWSGAVTTPSVFGSAASGGTLFLSSTSNATKGAIQFGNGMVFDGVNKTLNIGNLTAATHTLDVVGNANISSSLTTNGVANTGTMTTGNFTAATGYFSGLLTPTVGIKATTTNDNATAGNYGEYVSALLAVGSATTFTTTTAVNVLTISLTAGDWDVIGNLNFNETSSTVSARTAGITSTSATIPVDGSEGNCGVQSTVTSEVNTITLPSKRFSLSGTTTIYLVGKATFAAGTCTGYGSLSARRIR